MNTDLGEEGRGEKMKLETADPNISVLTQPTEGSTNGFFKPLVLQVSGTTFGHFEGVAQSWAYFYCFFLSAG